MASVVWVLALLATPAIADQITLTLDGVGMSTCNVTWDEGACHLMFTETAEGDYGYPPGYCIAQAVAEGVYIMPARLSVDVSMIEGIMSVEIDIQEASDLGRTRAFAYAQDQEVANQWSDAMGLQTFTLDVTGHAITSLAVSGWEAAVWEIRLIGDNLVANDWTSFSALKAIYR
jgi:hypothetical protein